MYWWLCSAGFFLFGEYYWLYVSVLVRLVLVFESIPHVHDVNVESPELLLLHNIPSVPFYTKLPKWFWLKQPPSAHHTCSTLPISARTPLPAPVPGGFRTSKHAWFGFMYSIASQKKKMTQDVTHRQRYFWSWKICFSQCLCGLFSIHKLERMMLFLGSSSFPTGNHY